MLLLVYRRLCVAFMFPRLPCVRHISVEAELIRLSKPPTLSAYKGLSHVRRLHALKSIAVLETAKLKKKTENLSRGTVHDWASDVVE